MAHDLYVGLVKDPEFRYSGEPEAWRDNIELVADLGTGAGPTAGFTTSEHAPRVDWATSIMPITYEGLQELGRPRRDVDVSAWRPFMPGFSDDEIRAKMKFDLHSEIAQLSPEGDYVLVSVEWL